MEFEELVREMKSEYFNICGEDPAGDAHAAGVIEALAAEVYALLCKTGHTLGDAFPQTAEGEYLDRHAAMRGIERKRSAAATGELTFYMAAAQEFAVEVPQGTVVSREGYPFAQFATEGAAEIAAGETEVTVPAVALSRGASYNAPAGTVTVMVNPPDYVSGVTNEKAFAGGTDDEGDASLRERVLSSYSAKSNCVNEKSIRELLLSDEEILDARTAPAEPGLTVYLRTPSGEVSAELKERVEDMLGIVTICGAPVTVLAAEPKEFSATVTLTTLPGADFEALAEKVSARLQAFCAKRKIGCSLTTAELEGAIANIPYIRSADIASPSAAAGSIACGTGEYLVLASLEVV